MKIHVTQSCIDDARNKLEHGSVREVCCPVALALHRTGFKNVRVGRHHIVFDIQPPDYKQSSPMPKRAQVFVKDFDQNKAVKPFSFEIDIETNLFVERTDPSHYV